MRSSRPPSLCLFHTNLSGFRSTEALVFDSTIAQSRSAAVKPCSSEPGWPLASWQHFDLGWVELHPPGAPVRPGTVVAVLIRHLGFWSLNGARIVSLKEGDHEFGFVYGTLANHAERGEELFTVTLNADTGDVVVRDSRRVETTRAAGSRRPSGDPCAPVQVP